MSTVTRRSFLKTSTAGAAFAAGITLMPRNVLGAPGAKGPNEKLNIAAIGVGGMGTGDVKSCAGENIVALCDADQNALDRNAKQFTSAKQFRDFRKMLEEEQKNIDAVLIATPDHVHAVATMMALKMGKHVHCQKPLTHNVFEARAVFKAAKEAKVATQMGNFGQASEEARLLIEYIRSGAIGAVREIHGGSNRIPQISPRGIARPKDKPAAPANLDWNLWLGPAPERPYHPCYHPFAWRGWWDFGSGCLGDIACHQFSAVFKALNLGNPKWVESCSSNHPLGPEIANETAPMASITRWLFPEEGERKELTLTWWDGGLRPQRPEELEPGRDFGEGDWLYIIGEKGKMYGHRLIPETRQKEVGKPPKLMERSPGHWKEWFDACRGGAAAGSDFVNHAAHLAEVVQLGNIALRTKGRLDWDPENLKFTNNEKANALINPSYREGWSL
jgi:predicted dehydrogenase